jgi:hypothetical protein
LQQQQQQQQQLDSSSSSSSSKNSPGAILAQFARHASVGAFIDAEVAARSNVYFYAKGNFDRVVRGIRARSGLPCVATHLYFPSFEDGTLPTRVQKALIEQDANRRDGGRDLIVYHNPMGTKQFMGCHCVKV